MKKQIIGLLSLCLFTVATQSCSDDEGGETIKVEKNDDTYLPANVAPILDLQQQKAFTYFYQGADPETGMAYEGNSRGNVVTIGGSGFGMMALIVGAERGWITREQAAERTLKMVRFLGKAERFKGMWSHWYRPDGTSEPFGDQIKTGDIIESAFMVAGLLTASEYYTGSGADEKEIVDAVESFWNTIDWRHYTGGKNVLHWLWYSQTDRLSLDVRGWHEGWETYLFALAAPEPHNISTDVYRQGWLSDGNFMHRNREHYGYKLPLGADMGGPMFFAHYSFLGLNPQKLEDEYVHYWKQNVAHTLINRHYCVEEAPKQFKYGESVWGLTACYGSGAEYGYKARSPKNDDGVVAPTAALGSYPYAPFYATQVLMHLNGLSGLQGQHGFGDSFRPLDNGYERKHLAIDQGPIVIMMENYRSGLIWNLMMKNRHVKRGLQLAGVKASPDFADGFHLAVLNTKTNLYDWMIHPDRKMYEMPFFLSAGGETRFTLTDGSGKKVFTQSVAAASGENTLSFFEASILRGKKYQLSMQTAAGKTYTIDVMLR